jgi:hypothetical protein
MMVLFIHASRLALVVFDPYLSSRPLAEALLRESNGKLNHQRRVLRIFLCVFLHRAHSPAVERPRQQSGIRLVCARQSVRFYRRSAIPIPLELQRTIFCSFRWGTHKPPARFGGKAKVNSRGGEWRQDAVFKFATHPVNFCRLLP